MEKASSIFADLLRKCVFLLLCCLRRLVCGLLSLDSWYRWHVFQGGYGREGGFANTLLHTNPRGWFAHSKLLTLIMCLPVPEGVWFLARLCCSACCPRTAAFRDRHPVLSHGNSGGDRYSPFGVCL